MNVKGIVSDSLRYPFRDWKKILILGIIILFSNIGDINAIKDALGSINVLIIYFLMVLGYIIGILARGYMYKIMKSSLIDVFEIPNFKNWAEMFINGLKVTIVTLVYVSPYILVMLTFTALHFNYALGLIGSNPSNFDLKIVLGSGIWGLISILYVIGILPISFIAVAHMANNGNKLSEAFKFNKILNRISVITWSKLIKWYITTGLIIFALAAISVLILLPLAFKATLQILLISLVVSPYVSMYFYRSVALIYISGENSEK